MPTKTFPTYLFLGEEEFLKEESVNRLKDSILRKDTRDLNLSVFYGRDKNCNFREILDSLNTLPFLSKRRMVILKDADAVNASLTGALVSYVKNPKDHSVFIIESSSTSIKGELLLEASRHGQLVYFRRLTDAGLGSWLVKKAGSSGKRLSIDAINAIKESLPNDLRILSSNMDSIFLYAGKRDSITKKDVDAVIGVSPSHTAFDLMNSIIKKDTAGAICIFSSLKKDKKRETELLGLLAWHARMLLRIKELFRIKSKPEMGKDLGLSPRMLEKLSHYAIGFKKSQVLDLLNQILSADLEIKTGASSTLVMQRLIINLTNCP